MQKLAGSTCRAYSTTLKTLSLALLESSAEYSASVWLNSKHDQKKYPNDFRNYRVVNPTEWLPVLCNIAPPNVRREDALIREYNLRTIYTIFNQRSYFI